MLPPAALRFSEKIVKSVSIRSNIPSLVRFSNITLLSNLVNARITPRAARDKHLQLKQGCLIGVVVVALFTVGVGFCLLRLFAKKTPPPIFKQAYDKTPEESHNHLL